jgi:hypothetical protein
VRCAFERPHLLLAIVELRDGACRPLSGPL